VGVAVVPGFVVVMFFVVVVAPVQAVKAIAVNIITHKIIIFFMVSS
jgi:hypothetical protein